MNGLYDELVRYSREDYYPFHMPGHKRNIDMLSMVNPYAIDITEIDGFDNLHNAQGIIKQLSGRISKLYGAEYSYPLVGGSTAGILSGISAAVGRGAGVIAARNCHRSVYNALAIRELKPYFIYPGKICGTDIDSGILPEQIEEGFRLNPEIKLVILTSPTYEGITSDIRSIAGIVHRNGALLMVDEAHGAHLGFHKGFPESAVRCGADLVVQSLHKTLPALTQTGVLHLNRKELNTRLENYLSIYQSSSPSYLLMSGIDICIRLLEEHTGELFDRYYRMLMDFYDAAGGLKHLKLLGGDKAGIPGVFRKDPSKLVILSDKAGITGSQVYDELLNSFRIVMEMKSFDYVLGITSICDTGEGFLRLLDALKVMDEKACGCKTLHSTPQVKTQVTPQGTPQSAVQGTLKYTVQGSLRGEAQGIPREGLAVTGYRPVQALPMHEAMARKSTPLGLEDSQGKVSAGFICIYPPGSPVIVPGEIIEGPVIEHITAAMNAGLEITGLCGDNKDMLDIVF